VEGSSRQARSVSLGFARELPTEKYSAKTTAFRVVTNSNGIQPCCDTEKNEKGMVPLMSFEYVLTQMAHCSMNTP